ncbi:helix-turn-helix transcriptional regulator [Asticcacaulis sp. DXS10W]|uniref:Helix-turn-helix transcriptional regulator n=1 Tax=Asticcacaulis currens TaxID=2984210 RepID=A0ABT5I9I0_9CAUL|nr:helix-turn-helix transcriptional regulator [Asticcacaulis currens]MDC7692844.1 helix-turn-helix transcriptional regulator [Asticcacaulis currens]
MSHPTIGITKLSPREKQVLRLTLTGYTQKEIARELQIEVTTVKTHANSACQKLGETTTRAAARAFAENEYGCASSAAAALIREGGPPSERISDDLGAVHGEEGAVTAQSMNGHRTETSSAVSGPALLPVSSIAVHKSPVTTWEAFEKWVKATSTTQWLITLVLLAIGLGLSVSSLLFVSAHMLQTLNRIIP